MEAPPHSRSQWRTVPNLLSFGRLVATPLLVWLVLRGHVNYATGLFGAMGVSDYLDGEIARRTNTVTDLGTTLDPVSDRILAMAAGAALMATHRLPLWLGLPVVMRDVALSLAFLALSRRGFGKPRVRRVGKTATFALLFAMPAVLLGHGLRPLGLVLFGVGALLYYLAAYRYLGDARAFLRHERRPFLRDDGQ